MVSELCELDFAHPQHVQDLLINPCGVSAPVRGFAQGGARSGSGAHAPGQAEFQWEGPRDPGNARASQDKTNKKHLTA